MTDALKPCPFCGTEPEYDCDDYINGRTISDPDVWIACQNPACGIWPERRANHSKWDEIVAAWNRRAALAEHDAARDDKARGK